MLLLSRFFNQQPTNWGLSIFGLDTYLKKWTKHQVQIWFVIFGGENGPKNLFRCPPRVAVCRVYKVTTSLHKSAKCATIFNYFPLTFSDKVSKTLAEVIVRVLYFLSSNSVAKCEAW